jgi:hypothetical protein
MNKIKYLLITLVFTQIVFSQKVIVPKNGTIAFNKKEKVLDRDLYIKSFKKLLPKMNDAMEKQIYLEQLSQGKKVDTTLLKSNIAMFSQSFEMLLPMIIDEPKQNINFYNEFKGDTIICYNTTNGSIYNTKRINQTTGIVINEMGENVELENDNIITITEFRKEQKLINNYNCFKVVYTYTQKGSDSDFDLFFTIQTYTREIWVTETIKCNFHPIINNNEILSKYYPLEILEYSKEIEGFETIYKCSSISLK